MSKQRKTAKYLCLIILLIIEAASFFPLLSPKKHQISQTCAAGASFLFSPTSKTINVEETFMADIEIDTAGQYVGGAGAKITFDPTIINVAAIQPGTIFSDYPSESYDNANGKITISGIASPSNLFRGSGIFAIVTFKGMSQGNTTVQFVYEPGSTRDSNIATTYGSGDILAEVGTLNVEVQRSAISKIEDFLAKTFAPLGFFSQPETTPPPDKLPRPTSKKLKPHEPIPLQPPIVDPSQTQPVATGPFIATKTDPLNYLRIILITALVALSISSIFIGRKLYIKHKKKTQVRIP